MMNDELMNAKVPYGRYGVWCTVYVSGTPRQAHQKEYKTNEHQLVYKGAGTGPSHPPHTTISHCGWHMYNPPDPLPCTLVKQPPIKPAHHR